MRLEIRCKQCGSPTTQVFKHVSTTQVLVTTSCMAKACKYETSIVISINDLRNSSPIIALKVEYYGLVCIT